ncbi:dinitrogenase iron-molybdenum cofactor [Clostridia bacterium]|nr:dinitrogenase iron-molybdenum cofactor [Clostridia bacterium]
MSFLVAVATTDGKVVNEHFGRADSFYIMELSENGHSFVEQRKHSPVCGGGSHSDNAMKARIALLSDCRAVLVSRAGPGAKQALSAGGIQVFELGLPVEDALAQLREHLF